MSGAVSGGKLTAAFMGTPDFAARILEHVLASPAVAVTGVWTQPDRPAGRGHTLTPPPVKVLAQAHQLPVFQPRNFRDEESVRQLSDLSPDVLLVAAYGLILPQVVLDIPRLMPLNVHASLLPRLRGAAPIQRAIMQGCTATGISLMRMEAGLDTGPVVRQKALAIGIDDTAATLHDQLAELGGRMLAQCLEALAGGAVLPMLPQNDSLATYAAKLSRENSRIEWNRPCLEIHAHIRGVTPWPGARVRLLRPDGAETTLALAPGKPGPELSEPAQPGALLGMEGDCLCVACADRVYLVPSLQPPGKPFMAARSFVNGHLRGLPVGCVFA